MSKWHCFPCEGNLGMAEKPFLPCWTGRYSCNERKEVMVTGREVYGCKDGGGSWASREPRTLGMLHWTYTTNIGLCFQYPVWWAGPNHPQHRDGYVPFFNLQSLLIAFWSHYIQSAHRGCGVMSLGFWLELSKTAAVSQLDTFRPDADCIKMFSGL